MKISIDAEIIRSILRSIKAGELIQDNSVIEIDLRHSLINAEETESLLKCFINLLMIDYTLGSISNDSNNKVDIDFSDAEHLLMKKLYRQGVTLNDIEEAIVKNDWTECLGHAGSGDRERGFMMEGVEAIYNSI